MDTGFIGLGSMGRPIAGRLLAAGHHVRVWNRSRERMIELARQGAEAVEEPRLASGTVVFSMLADDQAVRDVFLAPGMLESLPSGAIHVNMATVSVALAESLAAAHGRHGLGYVAAPVFGRPEAAAAGQLHIVAAGRQELVDRVEPLLEAIGQRVWRIGTEPPQANAVKLAGNFLIASAIESMAEAVVMTGRFGLPPSALLDVMTNSLFSAPIYKNYGALIADRKYEPAGFRLVLGLKDVRLALEAAEQVRAPMPFASVLRDHLLEAVAQGDGDRDWAALAEIARRHAGI